MFDNLFCSNADQGEQTFKLPEWSNAHRFVFPSYFAEIGLK